MFILQLQQQFCFPDVQHLCLTDETVSLQFLAVSLAFRFRITVVLFSCWLQAGIDPRLSFEIPWKILMEEKDTQRKEVMEDGVSDAQHFGENPLGGYFIPEFQHIFTRSYSTIHSGSGLAWSSITLAVHKPWEGRLRLILPGPRCRHVFICCSSPRWRHVAGLFEPDAECQTSRWEKIISSDSSVIQKSSPDKRGGREHTEMKPTFH